MIVKEMIGRWPEDKALWSVWASMLSNGGREQDAFEVNKMLYLSGGLETEDELLKLIQYYSFYDMPYQAADIMERELKAQRVSQNPENLTFLSTLLRQARDYKRAIPVLETAARLSGEGKTYAAWGEALYNEGDCAASETAFNEAINRGYDAGKAWMLIASCRYDQTNTLDRLNCDMTDAQIEKASITKARGSAIEAFQQVPNGSRLQRDASKWIRFIDAEKEAFDRRCAFGGIQEVDLCYKDIKLAYAAIIFTGEFKLQDESCAKHKAAYDAEFRPRVSDTE